MREPVPAARGQTPRQAIQRLLASGPQTARELALALRLRERDVVEHLEHLARSLRRGAERLEVDPPVCLACGYRFPGRRRLSAPSACPECRATHLDPPVFRLTQAE